MYMIKYVQAAQAGMGWEAQTTGYHGRLCVCKNDASEMVSHYRYRTVFSGRSVKPWARNLYKIWAPNFLMPPPHSLILVPMLSSVGKFFHVV